MITSTANEKIKHIAMLVKSAKARRKEGVFVVEGERMAGEVPERDLVECFVSEGYLSSNPSLNLFPYKVVPTVVSSPVFKKMSDTMSPQGIMCVCRMNEMSADEIIGPKDTEDLKLLILEGIQDPGNLGTMIRCAEGAGFDAVIADQNTVDVYNPKVIRSTMGSIFRVPVIYTEDLEGFVDRIKAADVSVYAAHLAARKSYRETEYGKRTAFLIGNEGNGLSDAITKKADELVLIPMKGQLESLNAAVAAALLMFNV